MISLYHLPHGQYGYNGHAIYVSHPVNTLPRHPNNLDIIIVRQQNSSESHHDFHVRRSKIVSVLQWLLTYIIIDDVIISSLLENSNLTNILSVTFQQINQMSQTHPVDHTHMICLEHLFQENRSKLMIKNNKFNRELNEFSMEGYFSRPFHTFISYRYC